MRLQKSTNLGMLNKVFLLQQSGTFWRLWEEDWICCGQLHKALPSSRLHLKRCLGTGSKLATSELMLETANCWNDSPIHQHLSAQPRYTSPGRRSNWQLLRQVKINTKSKALGCKLKSHLSHLFKISFSWRVLQSFFPPDLKHLFSRLKHHCPSAPLESSLTTKLLPLMSRSRHYYVRRKKQASSSQENEFISDKSPRNIQPPSKLPPTHLNNQSWFNQTFFRGVSLQSLPSCLLIQKTKNLSKMDLSHNPFAAAALRLSSCCQRRRIRPAYATKTRKRKQVTNSSQSSAPNTSRHFSPAKHFFVAVEGIRPTQNNQPGLRKSDLEPMADQILGQNTQMTFQHSPQPQIINLNLTLSQADNATATISHGFAINRAFLGNILKPSPATTGAASYVQWVWLVQSQNTSRIGTCFLLRGARGFPQSPILGVRSFWIKKNKYVATILRKQNQNQRKHNR